MIGFLKVNILEEQLQKADRLRIVFHATESAYSIGSKTPVYHKQLFGSQKILWKRKDPRPSCTLVSDTSISLPFIVQVPMIQFPPSSNIIAEDGVITYHCNYVLTAYLEDQSYEPIIKISKPITYMPFIETRSLKAPVSLSVPLKDDIPPLNICIPSYDYVPGDEISLDISIPTNYQEKCIESLSVKLLSTRTWHKSAYNREGKSYIGKVKVSQVIAQTTMEANAASVSSIGIPYDVIPSFAYSPVFSVNYHLQVSVKKRGKLWGSSVELLDLPIHIGTLGYGIHSPEEIKYYSEFKSVFDDDSSTGETMPLPKFLDVIEYEETLPVYCNERLPPYHESHRIYTTRI